MKQHSSITSVLLGLGLLVGASGAAADPSSQITTPQNQTATAGDLAGSDTMEDISLDVILLAPAINIDNAALAGPGITQYNGIGSSGGQRQMIGVVSAGEPTCGAGAAVNGDNNWGCQEVAPMSRQMNSAICTSDADDPDDADDSTTTNSTAEGLAICRDGVSIITDNASHRQYAPSAGQCVDGSSGNPWEPSSDNVSGIPGIGGYDQTGKIRNTAGALPAGTSGYVLGGSGLTPWKDVLRLIYTGCDNVDRTGDGVITAADCTAALRPRLTRCSASGNPARADIVNNYGNIFEGVDCTEANHCSQLRAAFRRDDASGTTSFFLDALLVRSGSGDLVSRARMSALGGSCKGGFQAPPDNPFCDGGSVEGIWPAPYTSPHTCATPLNPSTEAVGIDIAAGTAVVGDPIQRTCTAEDDLCGPTGTIGLVRAIRTPKRLFPTGETAEVAFPKVQCTRNAFERKPWPLTGNVPTCPDGTIPTGAGCRAPYFNDTAAGVKNFNCLNTSNSKDPLGWPGLDGRVYNFVMRLGPEKGADAGKLSDANHQPQSGTATLVEVAQWRQNQSTLNTGLGAFNGGNIGSAPVGSSQSYAASGDNAAFTKSYPADPAAPLLPAGSVCQNSSSTALIGCIVGNTRCTIGFAGREGGDDVDGDPVFGNDVTDDHQQEVAELGGVRPTDADLITNAYPIARSLFLSAIGGFENIGRDCLARGGAAEYCADEVEFARRFYDQVPGVAEACSSNGFVPIVDPAETCTTNADCAIVGTNVVGTCVDGACTGAAHDAMQALYNGRCVGTQTAAGCGRVTSQPIDRCDPDGPSLPTDANCTLNYSPNSGANNICG